MAGPRRDWVNIWLTIYIIVMGGAISLFVGIGLVGVAWHMFDPTCPTVVCI